jgi:hypothetical protein
VRALRLTTIAVALGALATSAVPSAANARLPPGVDALVSVSARTRAATLVSPQLRTRAPHSLLLAFVVAHGDRPDEHVRSITAAGLHFSPVVRGDGRIGATEVWQARARNWWSGRIVAALAAAAYPASITVVAYAGSSPYVRAHTDTEGRSSTPRTRLRAIAGSLVWTLGLSTAQRPASLARPPSEGRRVLVQTFAQRQRTAEWLELTAAPSANFATPAGASPTRAWRLVAVDVVVPSLEQLIKEGKLTANGFIASLTRPGHPPTGVSVPPDCPSNSEFEVGVEDDPVFLGQQPAMSPVRGFALAASVFDARLLRLNVIWGQVKAYGWTPYDQAVRMARERCWSLQLTIMPTPLYEEDFSNDELSARHFNIELFASFAKEIATRYVGQVTRFAIDNEPDGADFIPPAGDLEAHMSFYDNLFLASSAALRSADPGAQVLAGELAGKNISEWLPNVAQLPSDGVGIHPYGSLSDDIGEFVKEVAPVPLLVTEYGVPASHPDQIEEDLEAEEAAKREGARAFIFYQLSRADSSEGRWDTGIE